MMSSTNQAVQYIACSSVTTGALGRNRPYLYISRMLSGKPACGHGHDTEVNVRITQMLCVPDRLYHMREFTASEAEEVLGHISTFAVWCGLGHGGMAVLLPGFAVTKNSETRRRDGRASISWMSWYITNSMEVYILMSFDKIRIRTVSWETLFRAGKLKKIAKSMTTITRAKIRVLCTMYKIRKHLQQLEMICTRNVCEMYKPWLHHPTPQSLPILEVCELRLRPPTSPGPTPCPKFLLYR